MYALRIVPYYAALLTVGYVYLAFRAINARRGAQVAVGIGGDPAIRCAARVHGNFAEYAPIGAGHSADLM